jgi:regulator of replication initiation timing
MINNIKEDDALDVKGLMDKFKNIEDLAPKQIAGKLDELEQLRVEASSLRERFEKAAESGELTEEKRRQLDEEFASLRGITLVV